MTWRAGKSKGSITVYLSMIMLVMLSLVAAFLETARVQVMKIDMEQCLTGSIDAELTNYYKPLFEDYRVFFLDKGMESDSLEYRCISNEIQEYMKDSLSAESKKEIFGIKWTQNGLNLYQSQIDLLQVDSAIRATEQKGDIFKDQVLQYMKYETTGDAVQKILDKFGMVEESETVAEAMEEETKVEEKFQKSSKEILKLIEQVEGIACSEKGIEYDSDGHIKVKDSFAKKLCVGNLTKKNAGVTNDVVWGSVKGSYENPNAILTEMKKDLKTLIEKEEERQEQEKKEKEEKAKAEKEKKNKENKEEKEKKEKDKDDKEKFDFTKKRKEILEKQKNLKKVVQATRKKIQEACKTIDKLRGQKPALEKEVGKYKKSLKEKKDKLSKEEYTHLQKTAQDLDKDIKIIGNAIDMKGRLKQNESLLKSLEKELGKTVKEDLDSYNQKLEGIENQIASMKQYDISTLRFSYGKLKKDKNTKNPSDTLGSLGGSVLDLVVKDSSKISKKSIDQADYYYKKYKGNSKGMKNVDTKKVVSGDNASSIFSSVGDVFGGDKELKEIGKDITESLVYQSYITNYFNSYVTKNPRFDKTPLSYEQEYILCGEKSDKKNLEQLINRILLLRTVTNFSYLLTDTAGREAAYATAALLVGFTGLEPLVRLTQISILLVWAYEESLVDVACLLQGNAIPMVKSKSTFMLSYSNIFMFNKSMIQTKAKALGKKASKMGIKYEDYLHIFLLFENQTQKTYRTMDIVEENIKLRHSPLFSFEHCIYALKVKCNYSIPAKFVALDFMKGWNLQGKNWGYSTTVEYSY